MKLFDEKLLKFLAVGVVNTLVGSAVMFGLYNIAKVGYWPSTAANYIVGGAVSYMLNRRFTFKSKDSASRTLPRFVICVAACYLIAYRVAKPLTLLLLGGVSVRLRDNIAMLVGMVLYTGLNYLAQRFFAFAERGGEQGDPKQS